jgi:hypothetical protein
MQTKRGGSSLPVLCVPLIISKHLDPPPSLRNQKGMNDLACMCISQISWNI